MSPLIAVPERIAQTRLMRPLLRNTGPSRREYVFTHRLT